MIKLIAGYLWILGNKCTYIIFWNTGKRKLENSRYVLYTFVIFKTLLQTHVLKNIMCDYEL